LFKILPKSLLYILVWDKIGLCCNNFIARDLLLKLMPLCDIYLFGGVLQVLLCYYMFGFELDFSNSFELLYFFNSYLLFYFTNSFYICFIANSFLLFYFSNSFLLFYIFNIFFTFMHSFVIRLFLITLKFPSKLILTFSFLFASWFKLMLLRG